MLHTQMFYDRFVKINTIFNTENNKRYTQIRNDILNHLFIEIW